MKDNTESMSLVENLLECIAFYGVLPSEYVR